MSVINESSLMAEAVALCCSEDVLLGELHPAADKVTRIIAKNGYFIFMGLSRKIEIISLDQKKSYMPALTSQRIIG